MEWTRTHVGLVSLVVYAVSALALATFTVIEPGIVTGSFALQEGGFSGLLIATSCLGLLAFLAPIVGMGVLISGAKRYGRQHRLACIIGLVGYILSIVLSIALTGGGAYTRTGDVDAYQRGLLMSMFVAPISAIAITLPVWFLYKPNMRSLPALAAGLQIVAGLGLTSVMRQHSTLAELDFQGTSVFMPRYDIPLTTGPFYNWLIAGWVAAFVVAAMYALLLLAEKDVMVPPIPDEAAPAEA